MLYIPDSSDSLPSSSLVMLPRRATSFPAPDQSAKLEALGECAPKLELGSEGKLELGSESRGGEAGIDS
jgi:hypothetical protein